MVKQKGLVNRTVVTFVSSLVLAMLIAVIVKGYIQHQKHLSAAPPIDNIPCESMEGTNYHIHSHLAIFVDGKPVTIPAGIGIVVPEQCFYWLHTHQPNGVIHVEAPRQRSFTLGQFFDIWKQPLTDRQVGPNSNGQKIRIFIDGKLYTGNPRSIELKSHENIVLEVGPTFVDPPPPYPFDPSEF